MRNDLVRCEPTVRPNQTSRKTQNMNYDGWIELRFSGGKGLRCSNLDADLENLSADETRSRGE
jgi:hypothetical protein